MSMCTTKTRRKPDGTLTNDPHEYGKAWAKLGLLIEEMFPGYFVYGYDPGLSLRPVDKNRYDTFSLPLGACKALLESRGKR